MHIDRVTVYRKESTPAARRQFGPNSAFTRHEVVPGDGTSRCCVRFYELAPGKGNYPYHYHTAHEEVFYITKGEGCLITEEGERTIRPGDVIVCPPTPGGAHRIENRSETEALEYLEFDTVSFPEVAYYPRSDSFGVISADRGQNQFFKRNSIPYEDV